MSRDEQATEIVADLRGRLDRGERVDVEEVVRAHPDLADRLRGRLAALARLDRAFAKDEPPAPPSLEGELLGPYRLGPRLGAGGMGTVYLASVERRVGGLAVGDRVAVKVVHPHLLSREGYFKRFVREAEIGRRVRQENVVATLDCDSVLSRGGRVDFLVVEYVEGQTLRALLADVGRLPEELCRHLGREAAKALSAVHAAGAVHRDLKPDNLLVTEDHVVKLMDFGVARQDEEALRVSETGAFVGSVRYAAPEQFRGRDAAIDGRADLYALGLVLYEAATGVHPFAGDDFHEVLRRQTTETPRPAGEVNPQLSAFFEETLRTLLAKDPEERFASAAELLDALTHGERSAWWKERAGDVRARTKRPLRRVKIPRETALYGRDDELANLRALFAKAKAGEGQVVLVEGEAGIGKSRLVDEFVAGLQRDGEDVNFLFGGYPPGGAATASGAFSTAYREQFGDEGSAAWLTQTPLLVPAFDALLRGDAAPAGSEPLTKDSLQTVFVHATRNLAAERPTIVLVDDLHFAPEEGRGLFASLALAVPGHRVLLVGTARPGVPEVWTTGLARLAHFARLPLPRLGPKDLARLLVDAFRSERLAEELAFKIGAKSDGNPYFVFEIVRGMREGQLITQRADGSWATTQVIAEVQVPSTVRDLIAARMSDLSDEDKDLLDVASVVGFEFDASLVADALGVPRVAALKRLARIESRHRLVHSAGERFVFDHHQVQETLYAALPAPLAREFHGAVAEAIERACVRAGEEAEGIDGTACVALAGHYFKAARGIEGLRHLDGALTYLERNYLHDAAIRLAEAALAPTGLLASAGRFALLTRKATNLEVLARRQAQRITLDEALALADGDGDPALRARARCNLAHYLIFDSDYTRAETLLSEALETADAVGDRTVAATVLLNLGNVAYGMGRFEEALKRHDRARLAAQQIGDRDVEIAAIGNLGIAFQRLGRLADAREQLERQRALAIDMGDLRREATAVGNLGSVLSSLGRWAEAIAHDERQLQLAREIGARREEATAIGNLGADLQQLGRLAEALTLLECALALNREMASRSSEAGTLVDLSNVHHALGLLTRARSELEESLDISRRIGDRYAEAHALLGLATIASEESDNTAALGLAEESLALRRDMGQLDGVVASLREICDLRAMTGDMDGARAAIDEALPIADALASRAEMALCRSLFARLFGGNPSAAIAAASAVTEGHAMTRVRFLLWKATRDLPHLAEAKRHLDALVANAPPEYRESMLTNVRLHREIVAAAEEHLRT